MLTSEFSDDHYPRGVPAEVDVRIDSKPGKGVVSCPITAAREMAEKWPEGLKSQDDASWDWPGIVKDHSDAGKWTQYQLAADERTQGAMVLCRERAMRTAENTGEFGIYIEYLAAAPWNRKNLHGQRIDDRYARVTPIGQRLIEAAVDLSMQLGYKGRMGWHSKPGAESWYKETLPGLFDTGIDEEDENRLHYFEVSVEVAEAFKARGVQK